MTDYSSEIGNTTPMSKWTDSEFVNAVNVLNNNANNGSIKPINES